MSKLDLHRARLYRPQRIDTHVDSVVREHGRQEEVLLPVLGVVQERNGFLDRHALGAVADALDLPDSHVQGVADFYSMLSTAPRAANILRLCEGPACMLAGASAIRASAEQACAQDRPWCVQGTSCLGLCDRAPAALINGEPCGPILPHRVESVVSRRSGWRGVAPDYGTPVGGEIRVAMAGLGARDRHAGGQVATGRYAVLEGALRDSPRNVIAEVEKSGLRGCGGAGFPTGTKWRLAAEVGDQPKYVVCNADESEPGAFKDRVLLEGDPHLLLESMALAGYAVGANTGFIYIRGEYAPAASVLDDAIRAAHAEGRLGTSVCGTQFSFDVHVHRGAGAYICGEETALIESLEGGRGEPRVRPPFPVTAGYHGKPTVVNNVETFCKIPPILKNGSDWFRSIGTPHSPGTRIFTLSGHVRRPGAFEAPYGRTLRDVIYGFGLGMRSGSRFKMALTGGAAGTLVPESLLDVPLDFSSQQHGITVGSGAIIVVDESVSAVELLKWLLHFFYVESCGKCTPCRQGTAVARQTVNRIAAGEGRLGDLATLVNLAEMLSATSLCGLGQSVAWPIQSAITHFAHEFEARGATR